MTDTRHEQPRCPICRWPYRPDGCTPGSCCFRPGEHTAEYAANAKRRAAYDRLRDAGNPAPTLEDVDAEIQPKGLPVIELDGPAWFGQWTEDVFGCWTWYALKRAFPKHGKPYPVTCVLTVYMDSSKGWHFTDGDATHPTMPGHPTPEAAQSACEAAIVAAWRNR